MYEVKGLIKASKGDFILFLGGNSSGKTSLIYKLIGLKKSSYKIYLNNVLLESNPLYFKDKVSFIDERITSFSKYVYEEIAMPIISKGYKFNIFNKMIDEVLGITNIGHLKYKRINSLTRYEKILVSLSKALITRPQVLFIDDILKGINREDKIKILKLLKEINKDLIVIMTSLDSLPLFFSDYNFLISKGNIILKGSKDTFLNKGNILLKNNINIDEVIDSSIKLKDYKMLDNYYFDEDLMIGELWEK